MKLKSKIFFLSLVLYTYISKAQQLLFNNISNELNLPTQESYNVMQDSKGYIWISTEAGVCKYNGSKCKVFDKKNGIPENSCYVITEDNKGQIWILTSANRILQYTNDRLIEASFSKNFYKQIKSKLVQGYLLYFKNDSIIISTQNSTQISSVNSSKVLNILPDTNYGYYFIKNNGNLIEIKSSNKGNLLNKIANKGIITLGINTGKEIKQISLNYPSKNQPNWRVLTICNAKGESFISLGNRLIKLNSDFSYSIHEFQDEIINLYADKDNGLWIGTVKGGVYYFNDTRNMNLRSISLKGLSVSGVCVDAEKGVWCTTLEKGVFYCRNKNIINYSNCIDLDKPADLLKYEGGHLFASTKNNELIVFNKEEINRYKLDLKGNKTISDISKYNKGWVLAGRNIILKTNEKFSDPVFLKNKSLNFYAGANQLAIVNEKRLFSINYGSILEMMDNQMIERITPLESGGRCIQYIGNLTLLYGCKNGLYKITLDSSCAEMKYNSVKIKGINDAVNKILKASDKKIWVITKESGIYIYNGDSVINMTSVLHLPTERLFDITEDYLGTIWIGSNTGLIALENSKGNFKTRIYTILNGLPSNEINKVATGNNFIYVSSTEGISRFSLHTDLTNSYAPLLYINNLKVNQKLYSNKTPLCLSYDNNSLSIEFDAPTFKEINKPALFYTLKGLNKKNYKVETIKGSVINLDNLSPNSYVLTTYSVNNDGIKSLQSVVLYFEIQKPYWQNYGFIITCIICISLLLLFVIKQMIKKIREKEEEKTRINQQIAEFQLTALQAQMNPHFIFNAINSIQNYILKKKELEAYNYLAKFSKLIRLVLNNSEQKTLSLNEELETVKLYIELEQLRFKKDFEFKLEISDAVNPFEIQVPTMLIQPYVENAIWHGLMNIDDEQKGVLIIKISIEDSLLKISIEDNGIGRMQSAKYKKESVHKPIAMKLTEKRLMMINALKDYIGAKVLVTDLYDNYGIVNGTRVEIFLPIV